VVLQGIGAAVERTVEIALHMKEELKGVEL